MARLCRLSLQILTRNLPTITNISVTKPLVFNNIFSRALNITPVRLLREIQETKKDDELIIEGHYVPSPREPYIVKAPETIVDGKRVCYLCALDLDVKHTDVLILSQFLRSDGRMMPRRITGLCKMQQKRITKLTTMAHKAGLMMAATESVRRDPTRRKEWRKFNTYYDEKTLFRRRRPRAYDHYVTR